MKKTNVETLFFKYRPTCWKLVGCYSVDTQNKNSASASQNESAQNIVNNNKKTTDTMLEYSKISKYLMVILCFPCINLKI